MDDEYTTTPPAQSPPWPAPPPTPAAGRRTARLAIAAAAAALVVGGLIGYFLPHADGNKAKPTTPTIGQKMVTVAGTLELVGHGVDEITVEAGSCSGSGGYSDIAEGAQVVITDDAGATLAITHLTAGTGDNFSCSFSFSTAVPAGKGYYGIQVTHRGVVKEPESSVTSVTISLGN